MSKSNLFCTLFGAYVKSKLKKAFFDVRICGHEQLTQALSSEPVILAINHVCWWDPMVLIRLQSALDMDGYALMDRTNFREMPFFGKLGALPLTVEKPRRAVLELKRAAKLLDRPGRVLAIFPQGKQLAMHLPLTLKPGVFYLSQFSSAPVYPIALRYDFYEGPRAVVHLCVGGEQRLEAGEPKEFFLERLSQEIRLGLNRVDDIFAEGRTCDSLLYPKSRALSLERAPRGARLLRRVFSDREAV